MVTGKTAKFAAKRSMDLIIILGASPVWVTVIILTSLAVLAEQLITWDFGPLIVHEMRISRGKQFPLYKLCMFKESYRKKYFDGPDEVKSHTFLQKQNPDSLRLTGRIMKKYYFDELGQIFNVLLGHMSVVGPRPYIVGSEGSDNLPRMLQKAGMLGVQNNDVKTGFVTISKIKTDDEYLSVFEKGSVLELLWADTIIIADGVRALLMGKGL